MNTTLDSKQQNDVIGASSILNRHFDVTPKKDVATIIKNPLPAQKI